MSLLLYRSPRGLYDFQAEFVAYCALRRTNLAVMDTGLGKQAPLSEPVLTPGGWMTMGDIRPDDFVIGSNGQPTRVLGVHPQRERTVYRIEFSDGSWTRCGPDHLWAVGSRRNHLEADGRQVNGWHHEVLSTSQIITRRVKSPSGRRRFCIPMCAPVEHPERDLPVDPYTLGVILGDGSITRHGSAHVTTDIAIIERIVGGDDHRITSHASDGISVLWSREWQEGLCALGLDGKRSWEKHVPIEYLHASVDQRRALLAGLLDTDGHPMRDGGIEFSSASEALTTAVAELAESLGGSARRRPPKSTSYVNQSGERVACRPSWIVNVKLADNPFRLERKASRWVQPTKYPPARWIESITAVDDEDSVCISVEAADGLYLTRHHIVTHNTHVALATAAVLFEDGLIDKVVVIAEGNKVEEWLEDFQTFTSIDAVLHRGTPEKRRKLLDEDHQALIVTYQTAARDLPNFLTEYLTGKRVLIVCDEITVIANRKGVMHKTVRAAIEATGARVLGLTATPVTNSVESFYNIGRLLCPDAVGTVASFERDHVVKRNRFFEITQTKNEDLLAQKMSSVLLRKRKTDPDVVDQFPKLVEDFVKIHLAPDHLDLYHRLTVLVEDLEEEMAFGILRQFANHPRSILVSSSKLAAEFLSIVDPAKIEKLSSSKVETAIRHTKAIVAQGDREVIFCDSTAVLAALKEDLAKGDHPIHVAEYHGGISNADREIHKAMFRSGERQVMLASAAGERGMNLPEATYITNFDVPLLHSSYLQRYSRGSRIGSNADGLLVVTTYVASGTVEEGAVKAWFRRNAQSDKVIDFDVDTSSDHGFVTVEDRRAMMKQASHRH